MNQNIEIYLFQGFDKNKSKKIANAISFMASRIGFQLTVNLFDNFNQDLKPENAMIIELDELTLEILVKNPSAASFLSKLQNNEGKVILILDDLTPAQIPEYLSKAHTFYLYTSDLMDGSDDLGVNASSDTLLTNVLHDIVHYLRYTELKDKNGYSIFFAPPDIEEHITFQGIMREILHRGYDALPIAINPTAKNLIQDKNQLFAYLKKSQLAIHYISHNALTQFPEQLSPSLEVNRLVAEYCHQSGSEHLQRIIYISPENENTSELISRKIALFKNDNYHLKNAELVQIPIEKLKNIIQTKHFEWCHPTDKTKTTISEDGALYFIYPPGCDDKIGHYLNWFDQNEILYNKSQIGLDQLDLLRYHQEMLIRCNGVIIYNDGNEEWLSRKISDLMKSPGWGRLKPFKYKLVIGEPIIKKNEQINSDQRIVVMTGDPDYNQLKKVIIA